MKALGLASVCLLGACAEVEWLGATAPEEVTHVAILELNGANLVGATALLPWDPGVPLEIAIGEDSEGLLVGFVRAELEALGGRSPELEQVALAAADRSPCAPRLPAPSWAGRWSVSGDFEVDDPVLTPALAASWIGGTCTLPPAMNLRFDLRASASDCELLPVVETLEGCRRAVTLCGTVEPTRFVLGERAPGDICVETEEGVRPACRAVSFASPAVAAADCEGLGEIDVLDSGNPGPTLVSVETFDVGALPDAPGRTAEGTHLFDFSVLDDRVVVVRASRRDPGCSAEAQSDVRELASFDQATGRLVATSTVPSCFTKMVPDPAGRGFIAAFYDAGSFRLGRFDVGGARGESVALPFPEPIDRDVEVTGLAILPNGVLGVLITRRQARSERDFVGIASRFFRFDASSLQLLGSPLDLEDPFSTPVKLGTGQDEFHLVGGWSQKLTRVSADGAVREVELTLEASSIIGFNPVTDALGLSDGSLAVSGNRAPIRFVTPTGERWEEGLTFEGAGVSTAGVEWPALGAGLVLFVAQMVEQSDELFVIDTTRRRVVRTLPLLPATKQPKLRLSSSGEVWILEPYYGDLHRVRAL